MIEVDILSVDIARAMLLEEQQRFNNKHSFRGENGQYIGMIGEVIFERVFNDVKRVNTYDCDFIYESIKIDVKTKQCSFKPKMDYSCTVEDYTKDIQDCDLYVFIRINKEHTKAWILGQKFKSDFFEQATFRKKGDVASNGLIYKKDHWDLPIYELSTFKFCKV